MYPQTHMAILPVKRSHRLMKTRHQSPRFLGQLGVGNPLKTLAREEIHRAPNALILGNMTECALICTQEARGGQATPLKPGGHRFNIFMDRRGKNSVNPLHNELWRVTQQVGVIDQPTCFAYKGKPIQNFPGRRKRRQAQLSDSELLERDPTANNTMAKTAERQQQEPLIA